MFIVRPYCMVVPSHRLSAGRRQPCCQMSFLLGCCNTETSHWHTRAAPCIYSSEFVGSLTHFLEAHLEMASYLFRCHFGTEESASKSSYQQLFEHLETNMLSYCNLIDSSIEMSESTLPLRQHEPVMPQKRGDAEIRTPSVPGAVKQVQRCCLWKDLLISTC